MAVNIPTRKVSLAKRNRKKTLVKKPKTMKKKKATTKHPTTYKRKNNAKQCRKNVFRKTMGLFKRKKLNTSAKRRVTSRKQALAISYVYAKKKCQPKKKKK